MAFAVRHFVAAAALLAAAAYVSVYGRLDSLQQIRSDGYSYYVYLPSAFLYHDVTLEKLKDDWYGGLYPEFTGIRRWPVTGRLMNLHPIGTAVLRIDVSISRVVPPFALGVMIGVVATR
jgi:hypothetical protein